MSALLRLRDYQREAIQELHRRWDAGDTRVPMVLATGLGKGHPLETEVPTPRGWRRWGDLEAGDLVFGRDGSSTEVLEVYDRGVLETYRVTFSDESSVLVDGDHLWTVRDSSNGRRWGNLETRALADLEFKRERGYRFHIPMAAPLERTPLELPLDPYVVGALISNGSMTGTGTQLTTPDLEVAARVSSVVQCNKIKDVDSSICDRYSLPGLTAVTRALGMRVGSLEKRIPAQYLEGSLEQRSSLLHGLMDGDGAARDSSRRSVSYFTSSVGLARDVSELVTSLGGTGIVKQYDRGSRGLEYAVRILLPSSVSPFSTARRGSAGTSSMRNLQPKRAIVSVVLEGSSPIRCIRVAARDSLYLIGRQHIVTHNTVIFAHLIADWTAANPGKRVIVLVHTDELVQQAYKKIKDTAPGLKVGIVKAERNEVTARVIVASVQSLRSAKRWALIRNVGLIIVDECHHATAATYRAILEYYGAFAKKCEGTCHKVYPPENCPECFDTGYLGERPYVAGFTATLARGDKAKLSDIWQECTFKRGIAFGIRRGYLLDVRGKRIVIPDMDLSNVKKSGGDYAEGSLAEELDRSLAPSIVADAYLEHARSRKGLGFAPTVESAHHFAGAFDAAGIPSAVVHGGTPREERRLTLKRLREGDIQVVWNCGVLTEGFDEPTVSCIVMARPTKSAPLYQQIVGRGLRPDLSLPADARGDCLVLDVVGASGRHDLRTLVDLSERRDDLDPEDIEDLSLIELEDQLLESESEAQNITIEEYYGETRAVDFDPLNRTGVGAWLRTTGGTYFLPVGKEAYVLIVESEEPGRYDVAWLAQHPAKPFNGSMGDLTEHRGLALDMACSWAEEVLEELGGADALLLAGKGKSWRYRKDLSDTQVDMAERLGIEVTEGINRGTLSDRISEVMASRRIDPVVAFMREARGG